MPPQNDIKKLILNHNRRLQKLKEQQALHGMSVDPKIPLEIEEIEAELEKLEAELEGGAEGNLRTPHASSSSVYKESQTVLTGSIPITTEKDLTSRTGGDSFNVTIGDHASDVAIGKNIQQIKFSTQAKAEITETDLTKISQLFADLREIIVTEAPPEKKEPALERVEELEEAISAEKPDLTTMEYVKKWFIKNLPQLSGNVTSLLIHPILGKVVEATGELTASELKRRFGTSSD